MFGGNELQGDRIDAVPGVLGGRPLTEENVSQVSPTIEADDLGATAVGIWMTGDGTRNLIVETGPPAMAVELVLGAIQGRIAAAANERARLR